MENLPPSPRYATVVLDSSMNRTFDYEVPNQFKHQIKHGTKVWVPFRTKKVSATVVGLPSKPEVNRLKSILEVCGEDPFMSGVGLQLAQWISQYYCCGFASAFKSVIPLALRKSVGIKGGKRG